MAGTCFPFLDITLVGREKSIRFDESIEIVREPDDNSPFSALAFKIMTDPFLGRLTLFRVYSV